MLGGVGRNKILHKKCGSEILSKPKVSLNFSWKWSEVKSFEQIQISLRDISEWVLWGERGGVRHATYDLLLHLFHGTWDIHEIDHIQKKDEIADSLVSATSIYLPILQFRTFFLHFDWVHLNYQTLLSLVFYFDCPPI